LRARNELSDARFLALERTGRDVTFLASWYGGYRRWEDGYIAMLDALNEGKPVDPADFKGVWRMGLPRHD